MLFKNITKDFQKKTLPRMESLAMLELELALEQQLLWSLL
jgi:hypothetical protein